MLSKDEEDKLISELTFNNEDSIECDIHKIIDISIKVGYPYSNYFGTKFDVIIADKLTTTNKYPKPTVLLDENNQPCKSCKYGNCTDILCDSLPVFVGSILRTYYLYPGKTKSFDIDLPNLYKYIQCNVLSYKL